MESLDKIWDSICSDEYNRVFRTLNSSWYIDKGVKIEKFDKDGRIEISNTMVQSDFHEPLTNNQMYYFEKFGWNAGCTVVMIDSTENKINRLYALIDYYGARNSSDEKKWAKEQVESLTKKRHELLDKLKKIMQSL
jgi:hypothetical protein